MKNTGTIAIIDYGLSNLYSITKAVAKFTDQAIVTSDRSVIESAQAAILPGVGSFAEGMAGLKERGLVETVQALANSGKPLLGICLGAQLLMTKGYEFGVFDGLDIIPGDVVKFPLIKGSKIPQIGWNKIYPGPNPWTGTILKDSKTTDEMYFVHSYILKPAHQNNVLALSNYGGYEFCSIIVKNKVVGCQFHPEKSGQRGLMIIENFVNSI